MKKETQELQAKVEKEWQITGDDWYQRNVAKKSNKLQNTIYNIMRNPVGELYLENKGSKFTFDYKIYGLEKSFIERVQKTYNETKGNMGVLLNGVKGTGKTVTAEIIANNLEIPIILVDANYGMQLTNFLANIDQDVVIFVDEYEKVFGGDVERRMSFDDDDDEKVVTGSPTLLSLMDGTLKNNYRKFFLFTTNRALVNENMRNRPSRILYVKEFKDLKKEQIEEIVDDCLLNKKLRGVTVEFIKLLELITVDIVKSVIKQVNIFNEDPDVCCEDFNVIKRKEMYNIVRLNPTAKLEKDRSKIVAYYAPAYSIERFIKTTKTTWRGQNLQVDDLYYQCVSKPEDNNVFTVRDVYDDSNKNFKIRLDKVKSYHSSYSDLAF